MAIDMSESKTMSPRVSLAGEVHLACESKTWQGLTSRLKADAPNESCAFVLSRPSVGKNRVTIILREIIWPEPGEVDASPYRLEISADYISRVLDAAIDAGDLIGITLIHTHPQTEYGVGIGRFSGRDDWYEKRLFPTLTEGRGLAVSASIVLGSESGSIDARVWWNNGRGLHTQPVNIVRIVGPEVEFFETPYSTWSDHLDPEIMDRSTRLWGLEGRRRLQNLCVGIVGAGGTGSITLLSLATMGVGRIRIWDKDIIEKRNLHRTLGATSTMVGRYKAEALSEYARVIATASSFEIDPVSDWGTSLAGLKGLKDCDLIFSCVDKFAPRVPLNDLAYSHLIPVIDMASWIHPANDVVDAIMTHAHSWSPGIPCAWCRGTLTSRRLTEEAQGRQRGAERRIPYGLSLEQTDGVEPSVLPLNLTGAGLALMEFMQVAMKITERTPRDLKLILPEWELDESDLDSLPDCDCITGIGLGDTKRIRPVC